MQIRMMPDLKLTAVLHCDNMMKVSLMNYNSKSSLCFFGADWQQEQWKNNIIFGILIVKYCLVMNI